jgi:N-acetylneuraminic acid mutarotase
VLHGQIFVMGGFSSGHSAELDSVEAHDPNTDTWRLVAPMPTGRGDLAAAAADGRIYAIGGLSGASVLAVVEAYEPTANNWAMVAPLPTPRGWVGAAAVSDRIYVVGGGDHFGGEDHRLDVYDVAADRWHTAAPMPTAREALKLTELQGQLYAIGGRDKNGTNRLSAVERYNPHQDSWEAVRSMGTERENPGVATVGERIFAVGGVGNDGGLQTGEVYDPNTDQWRSLVVQFSTTRASLVATHGHGDDGHGDDGLGDGEVILAIGGFAGGGATREATNRVEALRLPHS